MSWKRRGERERQRDGERLREVERGGRRKRKGDIRGGCGGKDRERLF